MRFLQVFHLAVKSAFFVLAILALLVSNGFAQTTNFLDYQLPKVVDPSFGLYSNSQSMSALTGVFATDAQGSFQPLTLPSGDIAVSSEVIAPSTTELPQTYSEVAVAAQILLFATATTLSEVAVAQTSNGEDVCSKLKILPLKGVDPADYKTFFEEVDKDIAEFGKMKKPEPISEGALTADGEYAFKYLKVCTNIKEALRQEFLVLDFLLEKFAGQQADLWLKYACAKTKADKEAVYAEIETNKGEMKKIFNLQKSMDQRDEKLVCAIPFKVPELKLVEDIP